MIKLLVKKIEEGKGQKISEVINERDQKSQNTILIRACYKGQTDLAKYLIEDLKVDCSLTNKKDENCLHAAIKSKNKDLVE